MPARKKPHRRYRFSSGNQERNKYLVKTSALAPECDSDGKGRPLPCDLHSQDSETNQRERTMRLLHVNKTCEMRNFAIAEHMRIKSCLKPQFKPAQEERRGVVVSQSLQCVNCSFMTPMFKLFEET